MTEKRFVEWYKLKTRIHASAAKLFREREMWWCSIGENIGSEENGKGRLFERPVLVVKKFNKELFIGIPLSSKLKDDQYHIPVLVDHLMGTAIISQIRAYSSRRLVRKIGYCDYDDFNSICRRFVSLII